ncbi:MAG: Wzz/FepE/Etk N-terminal domain-containing protein [Planctomycetota bacterium]
METNSTQAQIQHYLSLLKRRRVMVIITTVLGVLFAGFLAVTLPKRWSAETQIKLARQGYFDQLVGERSSDIPFSDKIANVRSEMMATETVREILNELNWREFKELGEDDQNLFIDRVVDNIEIATERAENADDLVTFGFTWNEPNKTVQFITALRDHWTTNSVDFYKRHLILRKTNALTAVEDRQQAWQEKRNQLRMWQQQQGSLDILALDEDDNTLVARKTALEHQLDTAKADLLKVEAQVPELEKALEKIPEEKKIEDSEENKDYLELKLKIGALERTIDNKKAFLTDEHPVFLRMKEELEELQAQLSDIPEQLIKASSQKNPEWESLVKEIARLKAERAGIAKVVEQTKADLEELNQEIDGLPQLLETRAQLEAKVDFAKATLEEAQKKYDSYETKLREANLVTPWQVLEEPRKPKSPSFPSVPIFVIAGLFLGAGLGVGLTFFFEFVNFSFRSIDEAVRSLPVPVLGAVNTIITEIEIRRQRLRRMLYLSFSTLIVAIAATAGLIWYQFPDVIPPSVVEAINNLRTSFL